MDPSSRDHRALAVTFEMRGMVALVTLDAAPRRNALSCSLVSGLLDAVERSRREHARAIVIAGNGSAFCAGASIGDLLDGWMEGASPDADPVRPFQRLVEDDRVIIAAVRGAAIGGGFELTLSCDLVVAEPAAFFCLPELGHGVIPNTALAKRSHLVESRRALDLILTRLKVTAEEAVGLGLVTCTAPAGQAVQRALELATEIVTAVPPRALGVAKSCFNQHSPSDWGRIKFSLQDVPTEGWREGLNAFVERRKPDYERFWHAA